MKERGIINQNLSRLISEQIYHDLLMECDAGFPTPKTDSEIISQFTWKNPFNGSGENRKYLSIEIMGLTLVVALIILYKVFS